MSEALRIDIRVEKYVGEPTAQAVERLVADALRSYLDGLLGDLSSDIDIELSDPERTHVFEMGMHVVLYDYEVVLFGAGQGERVGEGRVRSDLVCLGYDRKKRRFSDCMLNSVFGEISVSLD